MATAGSGKTQKPSANAVSPARREAFAILLDLERNHGHSDDLLRNPRVSALSAQDRNLCTTLVMGVLRWQIRLDGLIKPLLSKPNARLDAEIRVALRLGALQLLFLDRIPAHAAIGESVALAKAAGHKFASGMVNAVLRKLALQPKPERALRWA
jgi:16S rRNA (cytosine967-C5)-methyltransferase